MSDKRQDQAAAGLVCTSPHPLLGFGFALATAVVLAGLAFAALRFAPALLVR